MAGVETAANTSEIWGDCYSLFRMLVDNPRIPVRRVYFDRLEGNNFVRPSFLIKFVTIRNSARNIDTKTLTLDMMIQYYADTQFEAIAATEVIMDMLSGWPSTTLPKYNFATSPPTKISFTGKNEYGQHVPYATGITIDPDTPKGDPFRTEDDLWQVPITFTMTSPRVRVRNENIITAISYELLLQEAALVETAETIMQTVPSVQQL